MQSNANSFALAVETQRSNLLRYARLQLRNDAWAEDVVSETVVAALDKAQSFAGQAQLKTWLIGILKHKVIDHLRRHARELPLESCDDNDALEALMFAADGHFVQTPAEWGNPEAALGERQFFAVLEACVEQMPETLGRVFLMREWLELDTAEICKELGLSQTNVWVVLHRARLRLRECLNLQWFERVSP